MLINVLDNVDINLEDGHKYALKDIKEGENLFCCVHSLSIIEYLLFLLLFPAIDQIDESPVFQLYTVLLHGL